jgi:hypothetical protein
MMNDYLGGAAVPVMRDDRGRVTHQATRTIYLPQPNYQVLLGGKAIDVSKLEHSRYGEREHSVCWRTIKSLNQSATHDDGSVRFSDAGDDGTEVTIVARQQFALPLLWQAVQIDLHDGFKRAAIEHAYRDYFARTIANFEAAYEGRVFRAGCDPGGGPQGPSALDAAHALTQRWVGRDGRFSRVLRGALGVQSRQPNHVDDDGFSRFEPSDSPRDASKSPGMTRQVSGFLADLARSASKDWPGLSTQPRAKPKRFR